MLTLNIKKHIKQITLFIIFIISTVLFLFNSKVVLYIDSNDNIDGKISYITPLSAEFKQGDIFPFTINKNNKIYTIPINAKLIKKIKVDMKIYEENTTIIINKAGIKLPYLPVIYFSFDNKMILDINNQSAIFTDISRVLVVAPLLLLLISIICFMLLFAKKLKPLFYTIKNSNHIFIGMVIFIILFELVKFTGMYSNMLDNGSDMYFYIFKSDSYFLSIFLMLLYIATKVKSKYLSVFILLIFFAMVSVLILDIAIIELLSARLRFQDAAGLMPDTASIMKMAKGFFITPTGLYAIVLLVYMILFSIFIVRKKDLYQFSKPYKIIILALVIIFAPLFMIKLDVKAFFGTYLQDSIIIANMKRTEDMLYSQDKIKETLNNFKFEYNCIAGLNNRKNIIILVVESLGSHNSEFFSGLEYNTPNIDNIAKNNIYSSSYYCNSYNSYQNRYNILTGVPLITKAKNYNVNHNIFYEISFIKDFQAKGYKVKYYSAADTNFDGTKNMVQSIGVDVLEDSNSSIYNHVKKRFVFNGVEDKLFYDVVLKELNKNNNPYLAILTTMSTHNPYEDPVTGEYSFEKTLRYADTQVKYFMDMLSQQDFFKNGILVITGDHRDMRPIFHQEYNILGDFAHASIPLIIVGGGSQKYEIKGNYSHTDLGKSLEYLALDKACFNQFQQNIFKSDVSDKNKCIIYQQLMNLALVDVKCGDSYGQVILDGNNTSFIKDDLNISSEEKENILEYINYLRLAK